MRPSHGRGRGLTDLRQLGGVHEEPCPVCSPRLRPVLGQLGQLQEGILDVQEPVGGRRAPGAPVVPRDALGHVPPAEHGYARELLLVLFLVRPQIEVADGDGDHVGEVGIGLPGLELVDVGFAAVVHDAIEEAGDVDELHLDYEPGARAVLAADVQDRELRAGDQGELLAREVLDGLDGLVGRAVEEVVEEAAEDVRVRREDAAKDEVVLQVGERHGPLLPPVRPRGKRMAGDAGDCEGPPLPRARRLAGPAGTTDRGDAPAAGSVDPTWPPTSVERR
jgi:hypothetical protein